MDVQDMRLQDLVAEYAKLRVWKALLGARHEELSNASTDWLAAITAELQRRGALD